MKTKIFLLILGVLCLSPIYAQTAAENTRRLYIKELVAADRKPNGKAWDVNKKTPDIVITVSVYTDAKWKKCFKSQVFKNMFAISAPISIPVDLPIGKQIQILVRDSDPLSDDQVGTYVFTVSDDSKVEERHVTFESVTSMVYFLSPYKSLEAHLLVLLEKVRNELPNQIDKDKIPEEIAHLREKLRQKEEETGLQAARSKRYEQELSQLKQENFALKEKVEKGGDVPKTDNTETTDSKAVDENYQKLEELKNQLEEEQKRLEEEQKKLEQEKLKLTETASALEEEQKKLAAEKQRLEEEQKKLDEEKNKFEESKKQTQLEQPKTDETVALVAKDRLNDLADKQSTPKDGQASGIKNLEQKQKMVEELIQELRQNFYEGLEEVPYVNVAVKVYRQVLNLFS